MAQLKDTTITGGLSVSGTTNLTSGGQSNADITLYAASGDSPALIFQRGTTSDTLNDYKIYDTGGYLKIKQSGNSGTTGYTQVAELTNAGKLTVSTPPSTDTTPSISAWISPTDSGIKVSGTAAQATDGDYLLISDASASSLVVKGPAFGSSTTTYLRNDGTWATPSGGGGGGGSYTATTPIVIDSSNDISHADSGVTAGEYKATLTSGKGNGLNIPSITLDSKGHATSASSYGLTVPEARFAGTSSNGLMTYAEHYNLYYNLEFLFPKYFADTAGSCFQMSAGESSKSVDIIITASAGLESTSSNWNGAIVLGDTGTKMIDIMGVEAVLVNTSTSAREPVIVDWSVTNGTAGRSISLNSTLMTVTVSTAEAIPTGYALLFKILYSFRYFGH